jgi:Predicted nucleotide-binding protein containing TIR-like domain
MQFTLLPLSLSEQDARHLDRAARCIGTVQQAISFRMGEPQALKNSVPIAWPLKGVNLEGQGSNVIAITSLPFEDDWFSHSARGVSVISTAGWTEAFTPPGLASFLMMEMVLATYTQIADVAEENLGLHEKSIGCLFDLCSDKQEISWKLRCGSLCAEHEGRFRQLGGSSGQLRAIQRILEACRLTAFGRLAFDDLPSNPEKCQVFIGSAGETRKVAHAIHQCLVRDCRQIECTVWTDGVFPPSSNFMSVLAKRTQTTDYAVLVAGRDDVAIWRGRKSAFLATM